MRTSRSLSLTEAGRDFYESAVPLISDLEAAESRIGSGQASPSGVVRVTAAPGFSRLYVVPKLPSFRARYPKVVVEMLVSERTSNLVEEGIDLAIRNGALSDSSLVARKIGESAVVAVASRGVSGTQRRAHAPQRSRPPRRRDFRLTGWTATLDLR
jgi:LysR family transcriptional regulator for bpeEF and oprC